jgi:hypothetical protein
MTNTDKKDPNINPFTGKPYDYTPGKQSTEETKKSKRKESPPDDLVNNFKSSVRNADRMFKGTPPDPGVLIATLTEGTLWLTKAKKEGYSQAVFKFIVPSHPIKANYRLNVRYSTGRIVNNRPSKNLERNFPGMIKKLEEEISKYIEKIKLEPEF